uniref:Uncharacterized protein n=1 Tax=Anguilla anguilla TaxID=7936 RepID=A0A0E9QQH4_ANGAN
MNEIPRELDDCLVVKVNWDAILGQNKNIICVVYTTKGQKCVYC